MVMIKNIIDPFSICPEYVPLGILLYLRFFEVPFPEGIQDTVFEGSFKPNLAILVRS